MTVGYIVNTETDGRLARRYMLQSSIARLDGSVMALYRTLAWEVFREFSVIEMSCLVEVTHLMKVLCLRKYQVEKSISMKKYGVVPRMDIRVKIKL